MKKRLGLGLSLLASFGVHAAVSGSSVSWSNYSDMATFNCSGTLLAGQYLLTAAHCSDSSTITFSDLSTDTATAYNNPSWSGVAGQNYDVALYKLTKRHDTTHIHFLADLTSDSVSNGDQINIFGFAGTQSLSYATVSIDSSYNSTYPSEYVYEGLGIGSGVTTGGDSGGSWLNTSNEIVAVHTSSTDTVDGGGNVTETNMYGANLTYSKDFILETIDGWHFPTTAKTSNGTVTITVQSLHQNNVSDTAYTDGNATITGGSCVGASSITPFEKCTYIIESTGESKLYLTTTEYVHINKPTTNSNGDSGGSSGGGSFGWISLAFLALAMRLRK